MTPCINAAIVTTLASLDALAAQLWNCGDDVSVVLLYVGRVEGQTGIHINVVDEELARRELEEIARQALETWSGLRGVSIYIHKGRRRPGEPVTYLGIASSNESEAVEALRWINARWRRLNFIQIYQT
ncbi:hypothetical protein Pyrfu_1440 [Pyrolobus fumarii 1A]|uniref:Molybdopterin biosynthesis MoaE protein n=1 Tax=Pyrolobus fumarii (strain DSM 11204 / 1A) TaxID=694429 RepID=G0EH74_PYRF1|nr:molybdenum cofactor biosynthesis protein MoaE [Pyrolobus fumarii]AEM39298.1 hypothetical protein Pyrfu_1440 [Pyrolobus fumarii 1A]